MEEAIDTAAEKVTRKKKYEPTDDDYELTGFNIDKAENGVVVRCSYKLKEEIADRMRKSDNYPSSWCEPESHVFEDQADAKKFIMGELDSLWP